MCLSCFCHKFQIIYGAMLKVFRNIEIYLLTQSLFTTLCSVGRIFYEIGQVSETQTCSEPTVIHG